MRRSVLAVLLLAGVMGCLPSWAGTTPDLMVTVAGSRTVETAGEAYRLQVAWNPKPGILADAVLVYAEPSHSLLAAHYLDWRGPVALRPAELVGALALTSGPGGGFDNSFSLPYDAGTAQDQRIVVIARWRGRDVLLADAHVNLESFSFTTMANLGPSLTLGAAVQHCCTNVKCGRLCTNCNGPSFFCDLINCDIECLDN